MKSLLLSCLLFAFFSCEKITPDSPTPNHVEIHVQANDAVVVLLVDGKELTVDGRDGHIVEAYRVPSLSELRIPLVNGKKATLSIHDYSRDVLLEIGEIRGGERYSF